MSKFAIIHTFTVTVCGNIRKKTRAGFGRMKLCQLSTMSKKAKLLLKFTKNGEKTDMNIGFGANCSKLMKALRAHFAPAEAELGPYKFFRFDAIDQVDDLGFYITDVGESKFSNTNQQTTFSAEKKAGDLPILDCVYTIHGCYTDGDGQWT
jgi:hypothetical protein